MDPHNIRLTHVGGNNKPPPTNEDQVRKRMAMRIDDAPPTSCSGMMDINDDNDKQQESIDQQLINLKKHFNMISLQSIYGGDNNNDNGLTPDNSQLKLSTTERYGCGSESDPVNIYAQVQPRNQREINFQIDAKHSNINNNLIGEFDKGRDGHHHTSKLVKFLETVPRFNESRLRNNNINSSIGKTLSKIAIINDNEKAKIYYNLDRMERQQLIPFNNNKMEQVFQINSERKCLEIFQNTKQHKSSNYNDQLKLSFKYDYIFNGSLPEKLRLIPEMILTDLIESLIIKNQLKNAVIFTINDHNHHHMISNNKNQTTMNEFQEFVQRGLMIHSIQWIFDAISNYISETSMDDINNDHQKSAFAIKLSVTALFHNQIFDLISSPQYDQDSNKINDGFLWPVMEEYEYLCQNSKQAIIYLEKALQNYSSNLFANKQQEHLFILTIHLYRKYDCAKNNNSNDAENDSRKKANQKLYIIDLPPWAIQSGNKNIANDYSGGSDVGLLYHIFTRIFSHNCHNDNSSNLSTLFSKSKIAHFLNEALMLSNQPQQQQQTSLTVLANLRQYSKDVDSIIERFRFISLIQTWKQQHQQPIKEQETQSGSGTDVNKSGRDNSDVRVRFYRKHMGRKHYRCCNDCQMNSNASKKSRKNPIGKDFGESVVSSSEQSSDTVIFRGHQQHQQQNYLQSPLANEIEQGKKIMEQQEKIVTNNNNNNNKLQLNKEHEDDHNHHREHHHHHHYHCNPHQHSTETNDNNKDHCCFRKYHHGHYGKKRSDEKKCKDPVQNTTTKNNNNQNDRKIIQQGSSKKYSVTVSQQKHQNLIKRRRFHHYRHHRRHNHQIERSSDDDDGDDDNDDDFYEWTEELWVDGPKVSTTKATEKKQKTNRIEQWVSKTSFARSFFVRPIDGFKCLDDSFFAINNNMLYDYDYRFKQKCNRFESNYHNIGNDDDDYDDDDSPRDTLSDCGDKKSDFFDEYSSLWKPKMVEHKSTRINTSSITTEPPKQLKLEQFLQKLSQITTSGNNNNDIGNSNYDKWMANIPSFRTIDSYKMNEPSQLIEPLSPSMVLNRGHVVSTLNNTGMMKSSHQNLPSQLQQQQQQTQPQLQICNKHNATSTTTSGHGTISEGECSSIALQKKTSSVSSPGYGSSTNTSANAVVVGVDGTSERCGAAGAGGVGLENVPGNVVDNVVMRQPATSSGYESTIQDYDDLVVGSGTGPGPGNGKKIKAIINTNVNNVKRCGDKKKICKNHYAFHSSSSFNKNKSVKIMKKLIVTTAPLQAPSSEASLHLDANKNRPGGNGDDDDDDYDYDDAEGIDYEMEAQTLRSFFCCCGP